MQGIFRIARHLALIALIARALLPAGWMPDPTGSLTICSVHEIAPHSDKQSDQNAHHNICPFAAVPHLASTPDVAVLFAPLAHDIAATTDRAYAASVLARFTPGSPRAPPFFA
jgi:hypothetical protein